YKANDFEGAIDDLTLLIELASRSQRRELRTKNDPSEDWGRAIAPRATGAVVVDPRVAAAFTARGIVKIAKQDYDGAIADFDSALRISPRLADAYLRRGLAWETKDDFERALADYDRALILSPLLAEAYNSRGALYYSRGAVEAALSDFNRAI